MCGPTVKRGFHPHMAGECKMLLKNFLIGLSEDQTLNTLAKKYGYK